MRAAAIFAAVIFLAGCGGGSSVEVAVGSPTTPTTPSASPGSAFFYQNVSTSNSVRAGFTADGRVIDTYGADVVSWVVIGNESKVYGDPVVSRLANGRWVLSAGTSHNDPRGADSLMYHESSCPKVDEAAVKIIGASTAAGCQRASLVNAKVSQVFEVDGSRYLFSFSSGKVILVRLSDATHAPADISSVCIRSTRATSLASLQWGEATTVIDDTLAPGLLLSDTAMARRANGTWVLFVKGIASGNGCTPNTLCELCQRAIYRTTSTDLITWSALERMVTQASVPDAGVAADGSVWLYWQNFAPACAAQDLTLAARAPITGAAEGAGFVLGTPVNVSFQREAFETNTALHYPTNGNPVHLPDASAKTALDACFGR